MTTRVVTWIVAMAFTGLCVGQETEEEKRWEEAYTRSEQRTIAAYPDTTNPQSAIVKRMIGLDEQMRKHGDPRYHSPDKPMILADLAAKELGIKPSPSTYQSPPQSATPPVVATERSPEWLAKKEDAWRRLQDYYPEYCDPGKIHITYKFVAEWDAWAKVNRPDVFDNPMKPIIYCKWQKNAEKENAARLAEAERIAAAKRRPVVWKRYVKDEVFQKENREAIAEEIRYMDGDEAADRFLRRQNGNQEQGVIDDFRQRDQEKRLKNLERIEHNRKVQGR